ncbi:MAG: ribonuclease HII [Tenericutes bacterium]|nr:ribonuclease HII [Mycoplasmatota bacterium]
MMLKYEKALWKKGIKYIVGVDEVGRGPLAGPLVAAAVILDPNNIIEGLNDSKQLSSKKRKLLKKEIEKNAIAYSYVFIDVEVVDRINVYQASKLGMLEAIKKLKVKPDYILSDAMPLKESEIPFESIIKGDTLSASIAAASIIAKEIRDDYMIKMDSVYPGYDFVNNKGYPTRKHLDALKRIGVCEIHRKTYKPVKEILEKQLALWE